MGSQMTAPAAHPLNHKFAAPGIPRGSLRRPRLDRLLVELFDTYSIVELVAAAGSGKTVQAQLFANLHGRPVAWLTLDRSDCSASGLIFDLATSLDGLTDDAATVIHRNLQASETAEEAAAILADSVADQDCLLVIDECQQITASADAASALDTFLEYVPEQMRVMLLGREELPWPLQKRYVHGQIAQIGDSTLNLTREETLEFVSQMGGMHEQSEQVFASTGGWVAGVAFASRFGVGEQPNLRDLSTYFSHQVLAPLPEDEQRFLLDTSIPDAVTREAAVAMCGPDGHQLWSAVSARHLPATTTTESAIIYHSLFRSFLQQRLAQKDPQRREELRAAYAQHLTAARRYEEATEAWLALARHDEARESAIRALPALFVRADWPLVIRWLDAFGEERVYSDPVLIGACIRAIHGRREFDRVRTLIRKLDREGRLRASMEQDPSLVATAAWAMQAHPQEALSLLDKYDGDARADIVRYKIEVTVSTRPVTPPDMQDLADVERLASWGLFLQGRLGELGRSVPAADGSPVLNPNVVLAPAFRGNIAEARALWLRVPQEIRGRAQSRFVEAMLDMAEDDADKARQNLGLALAESHASGFSMDTLYEIFLHYLLLMESDGAPRAIGELEPLLDAISRSGATAYAELAQCFLGLAYLRDGRTDSAHLILRDAVASMTRSHRRLLLPMAAASLSEAESRLGDDEAAREAAELAYHAAMLTGSFWALIQAIRLFPEIQNREADRDPQDSRWRRLVVAPSARPKPGANHTRNVGASVRVQPFGRDCDLYLDGDPANIGRIKILELVACLALHPNGIDRFELQQRLFPEADQKAGGNHFRQIAHKLRHSTNLTLGRRGNLVLFPDSFTLVSDDIESERLIRAASASSGEERRQCLQAGLDLICGPYLEKSALSWVEERRNYLELIHEEARLELARLCLELGDFDAAREACELVIETNRYSDPAYRILVSVERAIGSESSTLAVYRRAAAALAELGLRPGDARRLMAAGLAMAERGSPAVSR